MSRGNFNLIGAIAGNPTGNPLAGAQWDEDGQSFKLPSGEAIDPGDPRFATLLNSVSGGASSGAQPTQQLINDPSFAQRMFNPEVANEAWRMNTAYASMGPEAQQAANTKRSVEQNIYGLNDNEYANLGGLPPTAENRNAQNSQNIFGQNGGANLLATGLHNVASATSEEAANRVRNAATRGLLGVPESSAGTEALGNEWQAGEYGGNIGLQLSKFRLLG